MIRTIVLAFLLQSVHLRRLQGDPTTPGNPTTTTTAASTPTRVVTIAPSQNTLRTTSVAASATTTTTTVAPSTATARHGSPKSKSESAGTTVASMSVAASATAIVTTVAASTSTVTTTSTAAPTTVGTRPLMPVLPTTTTTTTVTSSTTTVENSRTPMTRRVIALLLACVAWSSKGLLALPGRGEVFASDKNVSSSGNQQREGGSVNPLGVKALALALLAMSKHGGGAAQQQTHGLTTGDRGVIDHGAGLEYSPWTQQGHEPDFRSNLNAEYPAEVADPSGLAHSDDQQSWPYDEPDGGAFKNIGAFVAGKPNELDHGADDTNPLDGSVESSGDDLNDHGVNVPAEFRHDTDTGMPMYGPFDDRDELPVKVGREGSPQLDEDTNSSDQIDQAMQDSDQALNDPDMPSGFHDAPISTLKNASRPASTPDEDGAEEAIQLDAATTGTPVQDGDRAEPMFHDQLGAENAQSAARLKTLDTNSIQGEMHRKPSPRKPWWHIRRHVAVRSKKFAAEPTVGELSPRQPWWHIPRHVEALLAALWKMFVQAGKRADQPRGTHRKRSPSQMPREVDELKEQLNMGE